MSDFWLLIAWGLATLSVAGVSVIIGRRFGLDYVVATMAGMLVVSNILAAKLVVVWHYTVPAGVLPFAATFLLTDLIAEKWGRAQAQRTIWTAFYTSLIVLVPITIAVHWKEAFPSDLFDSFDDVLGLAPPYTAGLLYGLPHKPAPRRYRLSLLAASYPGKVSVAPKQRFHRGVPVHRYRYLHHHSLCWEVRRSTADVSHRGPVCGKDNHRRPGHAPDVPDQLRHGPDSG